MDVVTRRVYEAVGIACLFMLTLSVIGGCAGAFTGSVSGPSEGTSPSELREGELIQSGKASWYGGKFHGRKTASGEVYNKWGRSAAHRTLPLGTWIIVERVSNGRRIKVKVNDRGPFVEGRILDLSRGAARELGLLADGVARVRLYSTKGPGQEVDTTRDDLTETTGRYTVQVGSFTDKTNATELRDRLAPQFDNVHLTFAKEKYYRVRVGYYEDRSDAQTQASTLQSMGFDTWVVLESPDE